jgi:RNA polymerase sigma-70 factor (ECF subfamily)
MFHVAGRFTFGMPPQRVKPWLCWCGQNCGTFIIGLLLLESDQQIVERVRAGDTRQYAQLVDRYKDRAMTLAVRLVGGREEAEEILQDAFLRAFRGLDQFRGDAKFGTWFYRILYNLCMTRVSRRRGVTESVEEWDRQSLDSLHAGEATSALERLEKDELQEILASEIEKLPERFRTPITLFYVQEMSYEDISVTLNQPLGTVKTNLFRGRGLLRQGVLKRTGEQVRVQ